MSVFLHADLDAFFASVEQLDHDEYRGKPVIVGGLPGDRRSVVSTASYEARKFGVHSAMPIATAYRLCPAGIYVRGNMRRYHEKSDEVMAIFSEFSPSVQQLSVDEAFLDITGTERLFGAPEVVAAKLKRAVFERTGLTVSIGLASNKYVAKIASGMSKPDGLFIVDTGKEADFMLSLPVDKIWGAGGKTRERLKKAGFRSTADIYKASLQMLTSIFGDAGGSFLYRAVRGEAAEPFDEASKTHSLSSENTFDFDLHDRYAIVTALLELCQTVMFRLLKHNWHSKTVCIKIRYGDFSTTNVQETSNRDISSLDDLYERVLALFNKKYKAGEGIRLLGVGAMNLETGDGAEQPELFDFGDAKKKTVEKSILALQKKHPEIAIKKARLLHKP
jgi:DNA polymerase-4